MAQNITLLGASYSDVPAVDLPKTGGGTASFFDVSDTTAAAADVASGKYFFTAQGVLTLGTASGGGGDAWSWAGKNPTVVKTYGGRNYLKDTAYNTWTPTTTATTLKAAETLTGFSCDVLNYDYIVHIYCHVHYIYGSGSTGKALINDSYTNNAWGFVSYPSNYTYYGTGTRNSTLVASAMSGAGYEYINSSGVLSYGTSNSYGIYLSSMSNPSTTNTTTIVPVFPQINARCSNSYFNTTNAAAVDKDNSYYDLYCDIIRVDRNTSFAGWVRNYPERMKQA